MKETNKKKRYTCKNVIDGRRHFIGFIRKTGENDLDKLIIRNERPQDFLACLIKMYGPSCGVTHVSVTAMTLKVCPLLQEITTWGTTVTLSTSI